MIRPRPPSDSPVTEPATRPEHQHAGQSYAAPQWLSSPHAQTVYAACFAPRPRVHFRRERWTTPDADFIDLDWLLEPTRTHALAQPPLVVLFHGLEGSSRSHYAQTVMAAVRDRGWRGAVVHFRGCSGTPNRRPRAYHSGDSSEIDWILRRLRAEVSGPIFAVGVSLGGNVLLKWLGETGTAARDCLAAACAVSAPLDLVAAGTALDLGFNRIYSWNFLRTLKRKSYAMLERHPGLFSSRELALVRTLRSFDDHVTAPLHGFADALDYWRRSSSKPWLGQIAVPTLVLNARDDPFLPADVLPAPGEVSRAVTLHFPASGGHVGFVTGPFPGSLAWLPQRLLNFLEQATGRGNLP